MLRFYKSLLRLRRSETTPDTHSPALEIETLDDETVSLRRNQLLAVIRLRGSGEAPVRSEAHELAPIWNSEEPGFATDSLPVHVDVKERTVSFSRPGAIIFRSTRMERMLSA
jgi:hypothetical protein